MGKKSQPWTITPPDFFKESEEARSLFSQIIGSSSEDIAIIPAVSYGIATAALNLPIKKNENVVVLEEQFPSNYYGWSENVKRTDGRLVVVKRPAEGSLTSAILSAINEKTAVVALPNCHWTDGAVVDLLEVSAKCRQYGAALVLDLAQSAGVVPFSVKEIDPDFVIAPCYKWLLGPYSIGLLYVSPQHQQGTPIEHSWTSRIDAVHFSELTRYRADFAEGARRFDVGEKANFGLLPVLLNSLKLIKNWRVERIQPTLGAMTNIITERAANLGLDVVSAPYRADHFVGLRFPQGLPKDLADCLARNKVYVSIRGDSVRVTPHLYTTAADIEQFFSALKKSI